MTKKYGENKSDKNEIEEWCINSFGLTLEETNDLINTFMRNCENIKNISDK